MKIIKLTLLFFVALFNHNNLMAGDIKNESLNIEISKAWARKSIAPNNNSAVYMMIKNNDDSDLSIISATNNVISNDIELHKSFVDEQGISRMVALDKIVIPAHGEIELSPGAIHIMLLNLKMPLRTNDTFPLTLLFEGEKQITFDVEVK